MTKAEAPIGSDLRFKDAADVFHIVFLFCFLYSDSLPAQFKLPIFTALILLGTCLDTAGILHSVFFHSPRILLVAQSDNAFISYRVHLRLVDQVRVKLPFRDKGHGWRSNTL